MQTDVTTLRARRGRLIHLCCLVALGEIAAGTVAPRAQVPTNAAAATQAGSAAPLPIDACGTPPLLPVAEKPQQAFFPGATRSLCPQ